MNTRRLLAPVAAIAPFVVAAMRVVELRARRSPGAKRRARRIAATLSRRSREVRAYVRLRMMRLA